MRVVCLNNISPTGLNEFTKKYEIIDDLTKAELIVVRSAQMHDIDLPKKLLAIARAGAGVNNIPLDKMAEAGVVVFNTPGANANGVKELVIAGLLIASRDIVGGVNWVKANQTDEAISKSIEKAKVAFGGNEIFGKTIGVIGLGAVGGKVAEACFNLGMKVIGFDPYLSDEARSTLPNEIMLTDNLDQIYKVSDFMSLHLPLLDSTRYMMNEEVFEKVKPGCTLLNFSRDALVDDDDLEQAIASGKIKKYVTDFPNYKTANMENVICIPHLGASTEESEENCAYMACHELMKFVETGTIMNSVNYPRIDPGKQESVSRIVVLHQKEDLMVQFMDILFNKPVLNIITKTKGSKSVTIFDIDEDIPLDCLHKFKELEGVIRVRKIS
ncbi:MAG: 3-phosphoglycerate dehydrogenase family protein [Candidatus Izemoplasmatales bacterium]|nr:3-phosphoglycerate dehydrogenase family protein [Candidatus Izemoplasmatales bacterium]